jgi:hypothetical protein
MPRGVNPASLANLRPPKPGEVRNPKGINGWTKLQERAREQIGADSEAMVAKLIELAKDGDVQALKLALGPILNITQLEATGGDGAPLNFADLTRRASEGNDGGPWPPSMR